MKVKLLSLMQHRWVKSSIQDVDTCIYFSE